MAMRLSVTLEGFAAECADLIQGNRNAQCHPDEQYPAWETHLPDLGAYPADENGWRHLNQGLASRCLNLTNKLVGSRSLIRDTIEYIDDEIEERVEIEAASRGMEAWQLASELRSTRGLPAADLVWDFLPTLRSGQRSMETREEEQKEQRRQRAIEKAAGLHPPSFDALNHHDQR